MGSYLAKPIFEPENTSGQGRGLAFGASSVQGWRSSQEDAHNCIIDFDVDQKCSLFAVYDGHGGSEVSKYCSLRLPDFIKSLSSYQAGDYKQALIDGFVKFDESLTKSAALEALKQLAQYESSDEGSEGEEGDEKGYSETTKLNEEANMPIEDVLKAYYSKTKEKAENDDEQSPKEDKSNGDSEKDTPKAEKKSENGDGDAGVAETKANGKKAEAKDVKPAKATDEPQSSSSASSSAGKNVAAPTTTNGKRVKRVAAQRAESIRLAENGNHVDDDEDEESEESEEETEGDEDEEDSEDLNDEDDDEEEEEDEAENEEFETFDSDVPGCGSGTTAVVALLKDNMLTVANAGDSRAVVCRGGKAIDMSIDHKPEDAKERERIEKAGGKVTFDGRVNGGLNLSRALGDHVYKQNSKLPLIDQMISPLPDVQTLALDPETDEFMVIACDGIWNCMTSQEVCDFVSACLRQGDKLSDICVQLFRRCIAPDTSGDGTGCDNMTCIVVQLNHKAAGSKRPSGEEGVGDQTQESKRVKTVDEE